MAYRDVPKETYMAKTAAPVISRLHELRSLDSAADNDQLLENLCSPGQWMRHSLGMERPIKWRPSTQR
jgi:hypothetical protein